MCPSAAFAASPVFKARLPKVRMRFRASDAAGFNLRYRSPHPYRSCNATTPEHDQPLSSQAWSQAPLQRGLGQSPISKIPERHLQSRYHANDDIC